MSQHDFEITTEDANSGPSMRAAINEGLQALASNSLGATEPEFPYAGMWWVDTTDVVLKQRNIANTAWVVHGDPTESFQNNDNLLINPISQINQTEYAGGALADGEYGEDMWAANGASQWTINSDGSITMVSGNRWQLNDDMIAADGHIMTFSILSGSVTISAGGLIAPVVVTPENPHTWNGTFTGVGLNVGIAGENYFFPKLERGAANTRHSVPNITQEGAKALYYFERITQNGSGNPITFGFVDSSEVVGGIILYAIKRTIPTITSNNLKGTTVGSTTPVQAVGTNNVIRDRAGWFMVDLSPDGTVGLAAALRVDTVSGYIQFDSRYTP